MRKQATGIALSLLAFVGLSSKATAQTTDSLKFHISQSVHVVRTELPPGDYAIHSVAIGGDQPFLAFEPESGPSILVPVTRIPLERDEVKSELQFHGSGDHMHLYRVLLTGRGYGYEIISAK